MIAEWLPSNNPIFGGTEPWQFAAACGIQKTNRPAASNVWHCDISCGNMFQQWFCRQIDIPYDLSIKMLSPFYNRVTVQRWVHSEVCCACMFLYLCAFRLGKTTYSWLPGTWPEGHDREEQPVSSGSAYLLAGPTMSHFPWILLYLGNDLLAFRVEESSSQKHVYQPVRNSKSPPWVVESKSSDFSLSFWNNPSQHWTWACL